MFNVSRVATRLGHGSCGRMLSSTPPETQVKEDGTGPLLDVDKLKNELESLNKELVNERKKSSDMTVCWYGYQVQVVVM